MEKVFEFLHKSIAVIPQNEIIVKSSADGPFKGYGHIFCYSIRINCVYFKEFYEQFRHLI